MTRRRSVTSVDVARAAGVSQTTVSLVFSGRAAGRVSDRTRALVEQTAAALGYVPSGPARVLRGGRPQVLALAVPDVRNPYFGRVLLGAEQAARDADMAVLLVDTVSDRDWADRLVEMSKIGMFAGAVVYAEPVAVTSRLAEDVDNVVFVECPDPAGRSAVDIDIPAAMRAVVTHLHDLGHRRIGHAQADMHRRTFQLREQFLTSELARHGIRLRPDWRYRSPFDIDEATLRAVEFLRRTDVTALFCDDDILVAALYRACARLDIAVPTQLSLVGFNDVDLARYLSPEATSVAIPAEELGRLAVQALLADMNGADPTQVTAPLTLTIRDSTARAR
ncbi:LacI family DNA-binding transcriptional regulator [Kutzneria buriramensis]|uniref:LacI family transcriptional regulator/LacI family repressor for deo operon, udp, cdd, tsx, nupC, and nupG n=1 Tax=Kutzneria buriramensis TaxID=1045776 RepID=A0A3E0HGI1_9PSEU|nr:LacI family DNA-binding transcriptional regulator [Kutzneria buriramensis]REH44839.1 LacI family transcriptional regulator/LacI family repressor for deo operon, udp, cdd, tsx, nupC, and nupG [Kutzneria buriramensis]